MPNIKSAMKRDEKSKLQNMKNKAEKSALKTNLKKFDAAGGGGRLLPKATVTQPSVPIKLLSRLLTARPARV